MHLLLQLPSQILGFSDWNLVQCALGFSFSLFF
jgi:hypothetical protein